MLRNILIVTSIAGSSVLNEFVKTKICETNVFRKTMIDIKE